MRYSFNSFIYWLAPFVEYLQFSMVGHEKEAIDIILTFLESIDFDNTTKPVFIVEEMEIPKEYKASVNYAIDKANWWIGYRFFPYKFE